MKIISKPALCYDDVLLKPQKSSILPKDVELETSFSRNIKLAIPLISSAMDTVTDGNMALHMATLGGLGVIHKNFSFNEQYQEVLKVKEVDENFPVAVAVGVGENEIERVRTLKDVVDGFVIDTAHGHSLGVLKMAEKIRSIAGDKDIITGNIATEQACRDLINIGVDAIKIGIGPGSICTTRVVAGVGVPQLQALFDCLDVCKEAKLPFIADGGIRHSGDIVKALAAGASTVMLGSIFAGCEEAASEKVVHKGSSYKRYRGMGSLTAMSLGSKDRYGQESIAEAKKLVPEGIEGLVALKGSLADTVYQLMGGLRSGMGYLGSKDLVELHDKAEFIRISSNTVHENHPHHILIDIGAPNYR